MTDYDTVARNERARLDASIPLNLRLSPALVANLPKDVSEVPETCGLLTEEQIRITRMDGTALAQEIASGKVTAVDAVTAVASRAAIAEQLVRQLRLIDTLRVDRTEPVLRSPTTVQIRIGRLLKFIMIARADAKLHYVVPHDF